MSKKLGFRLPSMSLPLAATILAALAASAPPTDLAGQEKPKSQSGDSAGEAVNGQHADDDRTGPGVGVIVAPSPSGSPLVLRVQRSSPADRAGIRHGDYILAVDGQQIESLEHLRKSLKDKMATGKAELTVWRGGEEQSRSLDFGLPERRRERRKDSRAWLGAMIRAAGDAGVEIARIYLDGPADEAGLKPGDRISKIDGQEVSSPNAVTDRIAQLDPGSTVEIVVDRDGEEVTTEVEVGNLDDLHEQLFGKRFRRKSDEFHEVFDPDFDGLPEGVFLFRVTPDGDDDRTVRELLREMRKDLKSFRQELRDADRRDRQPSDDKADSSDDKADSPENKADSPDAKNDSSDAGR